MKDYLNKMYQEKDKTWETILSATNKLVDFVSPTFGPAGNNVIIKRFRRMQAVDDGALISEEFQLEDPFENDVVEFIRQATRETNKRVEDGNVTTILLVKALLNGFEEEIIDTRDFVSSLKSSAESAKEQLKKSAVRISTKEQIANVAKIAFNNSDLADLIADIILDIGEDGVIMTEYSTGDRITYEKVLGTRFDRGYVSSHMTNDEAGKKCEFDSAIIFITDKRLQSYSDAKKLLDFVKVNGNGHPLVIVSDGITDSALNFIVQNKVRGYQVLAIDSPEFGERKKDFLIDLCSITGAKLHSIDRTYDTLVVEDFGGASKVISTEQETTIIGGEGTEASINDRVSIWKQRMSDDITDEQKRRCKKSIANLLGGVVTIKIGANTDIEVESHMPKVKNAVSSARLAYKSGVVEGGGMALAYIQTGNEVFDTAIREPRVVLMQNCEESVFNKEGKTKNFVTGEEGDWMQVGVMDPVELLTTCIDSAVSIVSLLVKSKGIINNSQ